MDSGGLIRPAVDADIPRVVTMIERLVGAIEGPQSVCRVRAGESLCRLIRDPDGVVFVSDHGFIAGCIIQTVISPAPVSVELGWHASDKSGLRLLRRFEKWSAQQGASLIKLSCKGGAAEEILRRRGYRLAESSWVK